ncbi:MAG: DUF3105 domain-containing protein [Paeniglutamicibacter terrestris]|jgi:hypothetical protein|uniref:DUF3105 domain-containing protein n=1 Tax=Paeniglutamicibacter terrestris TaxID=2723403 RepID=A0ABX1G7R7_9MICC|nr:DUF3105 domain-containing protein [Paeniglutamicibacter terrestris]ASN40369.1 hypothetical protein CGQ24_16065 [Arthrobacter sp. 7749]NKG21736.1 DUF3105 domain-containing protein [Paeniglutamicibacter terrestris]
MNKREEAQAVLAQARAKEKRTKILTISIIAAAALAIVIPTTVVITGASRDKAAATAAAAAPIEGVQDYKIAAANHVSTPVKYDQTPGVGGDHNPVWLNCGVYQSPVPETNAVHSLEHGAVWITYDGISDEDVAALTKTVGEKTYMLLSPYPEQGAKIKLSAWGEQLSVDSVDDPRISTFITKYRQGPQTPEPGAPCTGGI